MSDLAPFVAAALRDKVMYEVYEENQKLKQETHHWTVRFMDPTGSPVCATGKLSQGDLLKQHFREEHGCQQIYTLMKAHKNYCCTFRNLCENIKLEMLSSCGRNISCFIQELVPCLDIVKDNDNFLRVDFDLLADQVFSSLHIYISLDESDTSILLDDPKVSVRLEDLKDGCYGGDLDWAFTKTGLSNVMVSFHNIFLYLDAKHLTQHWRDTEDDSGDDNDTDKRD